MTSKADSKSARKPQPALDEIMDLLSALESKVKTLHAKDAGKLIDTINVLRSKIVGALRPNSRD